MDDQFVFLVRPVFASEQLTRVSLNAGNSLAGSGNAKYVPILVAAALIL